MNSGIILMGVYVFFVVVGNAIAWQIGLFVEARWPAASLLVFLAMFFTILVLAWPLAVLATARWDDEKPPA
ncbi:MAG TPA: hypothetical protein VF601_20290 [Beijerinckiaceae bacterium]|jgi:uncharacterized membrane protein YhaH (DUF805 family)